MAASARSKFACVIIGGSAGALNVVRRILRALPAMASAPVVIVLHLSARAPDGLPELLSFDCALPVKQAEDKEPMQPGTVYVAPPGYHLLIERRGSFALSVDEPVHFSRPAIDVLFESAADAFGEQLLAILLSGASADGAAGLQEVAAAAGMTIVQAPASAEAKTMPASALTLFEPTFVWTPAELERELPRLLASGSPLDSHGSPA